MILSCSILWKKVTLLLHNLDDWCRISHNSNIFGQRCFSNNPSILILVVHVQAQCSSRIDWISQWRLLCLWSTCRRWLIPMTVIISISLMKGSESKDIPRVRNPGGLNRIVNPLVQILNERGGLHGARFGRVPLPAVPLLRLQVKVIDQFHNTKVTIP